MKDYQRKKNNKYILPGAVYMQTVWTIRDYKRMKEEAASLLLSSPPPPDGQPKGTGTGDEVASKAFRREEILRKIKAIDTALEVVPREYRKGVWHSVVERRAFPRDADRATYGRWKSRFVFEAAVRLGIF